MAGGAYLWRVSKGEVAISILKNRHQGSSGGQRGAGSFFENTVFSNAWSDGTMWISQPSEQASHGTS